MGYALPNKLVTTVVGSYPYFPEALEAFRLRKNGVRGGEYEELIRKAIECAVKDYISAGLDLISDGEQRREDMVVFFAEELRGFEVGRPVRIFDNVYFRKPVIVDRIEWDHEITVRDWAYAASLSEGRPVKATLTGPYTMYSWSFDKHYGDMRRAILDLAEALSREVRALVDRGARCIQIDEPALSTNPGRGDVLIAGEALEIILGKLSGVKRIMHVCYGRIEKLFPDVLDFPIDQLDLELKNSGYAILKILKEYSFDKELGFGVIDVHSERIETVEEVLKDIALGLEILPPEKLYVKPDCGLKRLKRGIALAKLRNMVAAAREARERLA